MKPYKLILLTLAIACGSTEERGMDSTPVADDTTPPVVLSTTPTDGAEGVLASTLVTFEFDEEMDPIATLGAITANVSVDDAYLDATGTRMTVHIPLEYDAPGTEKTRFTVAVGTEATDVAGNPLATPVQVSFTTAYQHTLVIVPAFNNRHLRDGNSGTWLGAGDSNDDDEIQGVASFNLEDLPLHEDVYVLQDARFESSVFSVRGNPGVDFGAMVIDRIGPIDSWAAGYEARSLGRHDEPLFDNAASYAIGEPVVLDMTSLLDAALRDGDGFLRFRVSFEGVVSADQEGDALYISTRNSTLTITYLTL